MPKQPSAKLQKLHQFYHQLKDRFHSSHGHARDWLTERSLDVGELRTNSQQLLAATSLAGMMALGKPVDLNQLQPPQSQEKKAENQQLAELTAEEFQAIMEKMRQVVQMPPGQLPKEEELYLEQQLTDILGFEVAAELEGNRLNHTFGVMGGEQHLRRFPSDTLAQHDAYQEAGMAPNRGAFGWFTENGELTSKAIEREKYYFAVQTLYLPDWNTRHPELKPWYKFRKMIVINPADQVAVVGVVGDAGPALWVNKQYGGSPEVIREGKIWSKAARGKVILLFVNDPEDTIPLGPIELHSLAGYDN
ncbi:MAG TPA: hypothetical protein VF209_00390 [Patescibacteria group bacterium]